MIYQPLDDALAAREAVAFVGSGASVPSGLPTWRQFLRDFISYAETLSEKDPNRKNDEWSLTKRLATEGDLLLAAEMLQRELPSATFSAYVKKVFGRVAEPNEIHRSIARLPFALAITTNFDVLLESAYHNPPCFTWRDINGVFDAIRSKDFAVVKLHGSVDDVEAIRLTRTQYREISLGNTEFNECLKTLLTWKTFLFIGHSLRDSDLLHLMDQAKVRFGKKFGPHYAILPEEEVDDKFKSYLREALSIEVIIYGNGCGDKNQELVRILKILAGRVARARYRANGVGGLDASLTRAQAAQRILDHAVPLTGSHRGEVFLIKDDTNPELVRIAASPLTSTLPTFDHESVIGTAFLQASADPIRDFIKLSDVFNADFELKALGYQDAHYVMCDAAVRSELACPIFADGRRVGALNLEADVYDAYTDDHVDVAREIARTLGRVYGRSEHRRRIAAPLAAYYSDPMKFECLMNKSRLMRTLGHEFLLYEIDYEKKILLTHYRDKSKQLRYEFDEPSLATRVFRTGEEELVENELAVQPATDDQSRLNLKGVQLFNISCPVFACPIRAGGQTEAVLVTWLRDGYRSINERFAADAVRVFKSASSQARRLANVLANDIYGSEPPRAEQFLDELYSLLQNVDNGEIWMRERLKDVSFREAILGALMKSAIHRSCGLRRIRVWRRTEFALSSELGRAVQTPRRDRRAKLATSLKEGYVCVDSLTTPGPSTVTGQPERGFYTNCTTIADDVYCRYTKARFAHDPYAQWQHPQMFGQKDRNSAMLDKDPEGSWIVAPVVMGRQLLGFLSSDSHEITPQGPKDKRGSDSREIILQCRMMDLLSDLAKHVLAIHTPRSLKARAAER
jgi:NAD-dependent SIR2 family protein deacetylase